LVSYCCHRSSVDACRAVFRLSHHSIFRLLDTNRRRLSRTPAPRP
jgi:hypothetical protein